MRNTREVFNVKSKHELEYLLSWESSRTLEGKGTGETSGQKPRHVLHPHLKIYC
jgi:hypothetical protein